MSYARALKCRACGKEYPLDPIWVCEYCFGPIEVVYDYEKMAKNITLRRQVEEIDDRISTAKGRRQFSGNILFVPFDKGI